MSKVTLWTGQGRLLDRKVRANERVTFDGGLRLDVDGIGDWLVETLAGLGSHPIETIVPVGHGAGVVALRNQAPAFPPLDYEQPILAAIRAEYRSANAAQLQSVYNYQRAVLNAFTEVVNRIAKIENFSLSIERKKQRVASLEAAVESASKLFQAARVEYIEVLLAQRDLQEARAVLIDTKREQLSAIVNAY